MGDMITPETTVSDLPGYSDLGIQARNALSAAGITDFAALLFPRLKERLRQGGVRDRPAKKVISWSREIGVLCERVAAKNREASVTCCREEHKTRHCPHCGRILRQHGLETLRNFCRVHKERTVVNRNHTKLWLDEAPPGTEPKELARLKQQMEQSRKTYQKWEAWVQALDRVLEEQP